MDGCDRMRNADADVSICNQIIKRLGEEITTTDSVGHVLKGKCTPKNQPDSNQPSIMSDLGC